MKRLIVNTHKLKAPPPQIIRQQQAKSNCIPKDYGPGTMLNTCCQLTMIMEYEEIATDNQQEQ
jgi:hypothetical protein